MRSTSASRLADCRAARPVDDRPAELFSRWQLQAAEDLVLETVRTTLARDETASMVVTRMRALIAAGSALAGFAVVNAARAPCSPQYSDRAAASTDRSPAHSPFPAGQSQ